MRNIPIVLSLFCLSYSCEFHHRPDPPETFQQAKISGIDVFCFSKPTFAYTVIKTGVLNGAPERYAEYAVAEALKLNCNAVILLVEKGRFYECVKYTEVLPLYGLPQDTVLAMFTRNINRGIDSYCYATPTRDFTIQYHGNISESEKRFKWMIAEAERKAINLGTDGVIIHPDKRSYDCINYKEDK